MDLYEILYFIASLSLAAAALVPLIFGAVWVGIWQLRWKHRKFIEIADSHEAAYTLVDKLIFLDGRYVHTDVSPKAKAEWELIRQAAPTLPNQEPTNSVFRRLQYFGFYLFEKSRKRHLKFIFEIPILHGTIFAFEYGDKVAKRSRKRDSEETHAVAICSDLLPQVRMTISNKKGIGDLDLPLDRRFMRRYAVAGTNKTEAQDVLTHNVVEALINFDGFDYEIELAPKALLLYKSGQLSPRRLQYLKKEAEKLFMIFASANNPFEIQPSRHMVKQF
ncbi:MAG: hypothetical protein AAF633_02725 [Chloroflexota bacterium]